MDELDFSDLKPIQLPVKLPAEIGGDAKYVLCEASASAAKAYRNAIARQAKFTVENGEPKVTGVGDIAEVQPLLVSECLFRVNDKGELFSVGRSFVDRMPDRITKKLFAKAMEISPALRESQEEKAKMEANSKNSLTSGATTSSSPTS